MKSQKLPSFWIFFWVSVFLCLVGWGGIVYIILNTLPDLGPRWLFFFFLMLGLSGLALPVAYFINLRFPSEPPVDSGVVLREAMWVGIYGCAVAWLQLGRVLTAGMVVILAMGFALVEVLLRLRERSHWAPTEEEEVKVEHE